MAGLALLASRVGVSSPRHDDAHLKGHAMSSQEAVRENKGQIAQLSAPEAKHKAGGRTDQTILLPALESAT